MADEEWNKSLGEDKEAQNSNFNQEVAIHSDQVKDGDIRIFYDGAIKKKKYTIGCIDSSRDPKVLSEILHLWMKYSLFKKLWSRLYIVDSGKWVSSVTPTLSLIRS